jgi:hypothetical protein
LLSAGAVAIITREGGTQCHTDEVDAFLRLTGRLAACLGETADRTGRK